MSEALANWLQPCGPVRDAEAAARLHERLAEAADADGWRATLDAAWAALEPVFAASPYLAGLARRCPDRLRRTLDADPEARLAEILAGADALTGAPDEAKAPLRRLKANCTC